MSSSNLAVLEKPLKNGTRAQAKQASHDKISMAARKLFSEYGYEATTLRQIADAAGLALATLFNHISDKRDLIYLIYNDELEELTYKAIAAPRPWQNFEEKILTISELFFRLYAGEPLLARILLSEVLQEEPGTHLKRHWDLRKLLISELVKLAAAAQETGELKSDRSAEEIGQSVFFAYNGSSRWWIASPSPSWRSGQRLFHNMLSMMLNGIRSNPLHLQASRMTKPSSSKGQARR